MLQPSLGVHERMNKLVSVSQTVEHSSTIISDILSRILNETVMREETICRICFNLLNDIDYHLKEAQEKTDEITNKFLDKGKDPLNYRPQPIVTASEPSNEEEVRERPNKGSKGDGGSSRKGHKYQGSSKKRRSNRAEKETPAPPQQAPGYREQGQ